MKVFYSDAHADHAPQSFLKAGRPAPHPESPPRAIAIAEALVAGGYELRSPVDRGLEPALSVHDAGLVRFLQSGYDAWVRLAGAGPEIVPNVHPGRRFRHRPQSVVGQAGFYMQDTACPIGAGTWKAALGASHCAVDAALAVVGGEKSSYALCRPPGHHATRDQAGGFCYLNNSAIAAQTLRAGFDRIAVLDIDVHHGNGTQDIFYGRDDVFFASIHSHPDAYYPFFSGTPSEIGEGEGLGCNLNVTFPFGSGDAEVANALSQALAAVRDYAPGALVLSLGLDAHVKDPHGAHRVSTAGFLRMADAICNLDLPTVLVQEGGYLHDELGSVVHAVLRRFEGKPA